MKVISEDKYHCDYSLTAGPSILLSDNDDFTDISHLLNSEEVIRRSDPARYTVTLCNNKVN